MPHLTDFSEIWTGASKCRRTGCGQEISEKFIFKVWYCHENIWTQKKHPFIASIFGRSIFLWGLRQSFSSEKVRWGFFPERSCLSKYGVFSGLYFPLFGLNTEIYSVNLGIQSAYGKIRPRKTSVFGQFSHSVWLLWELETYSKPC